MDPGVRGRLALLSSFCPVTCGRIVRALQTADFLGRGYRSTPKACAVRAKILPTSPARAIN
jgi:hypothetical protein